MGSPEVKFPVRAGNITNVEIIPVSELPNFLCKLGCILFLSLKFLDAADQSVSRSFEIKRKVRLRSSKAIMNRR